MELRLARRARDRYGFADVPASMTGDAIVLDPDAASVLASAMAPGDEERRARIATEVAAIGLIHELGHRAVAVERRGASGAGGPIARALVEASTRLGRDAVDSGLAAFEAAFPSAPVYRREVDVRTWLARPDGEVPGPEGALEELALTWVALQNPAVAPYRELLDDAPLAPTTYPLLVRALSGADVPPDDPERDRKAPARPLIERLLEPARAAPASLAAQLRWIRSHWAGWLDPADLARIDRQLLGLEAVERDAFLRHRRGPPDGADARPGALAGFARTADEPEAFSEDRDWMSELVLLAKSTYVWLAQLSRQYGREISRLDQVPDEELDEVRSRGFSGLWLIGIWERSRASRDIKRRRGNVEALASAYSVADYRIADELGGEPAWQDLRDRAAARGLRLAADMVPNHMGIDSTWVIEHPERFISSPYPPFEAYRYDGPDLSPDGRAVIQLEDHYWDSSDAAVTFRRLDRATGETRYIYHGNDGTSFPWNDTAQLDYLRPDVREAVIGQILDVARRFPVIRFDAAMVLAKRHIRRLWYPPPGQEAGIPSRNAAAIPDEAFERRMPTEFWREVVDRVAAEAPDTLLLAEAFWLLEGYFVRTLGMHRVYNSAFMHMLRDEKNAEYQKVIRETIAFDARILGRYVNFMNNPDERSAIDQFGSHDKYFGVATLLATLPGLPMFGHGQVEGYAEQYGMEFRRPMRDEWPDGGLVARHRREIFPLLHQRWRFAGAAGFRQLVAREDGAEIADVFAFSNHAEAAPPGAEERRSLVVYLNRYPRAHVRIDGAAQALGLSGSSGSGSFAILRDHRTGLDFLRELADLRERGLELVLDGYGCHVFLGFDVVEGPGWRELASRIGLQGVADAHAERRRLLEEPIREAVGALAGSLFVEAALAPSWVEREPAGQASRASGSEAPPEDGASQELVGALARIAAATGSRATIQPMASTLGSALSRVARGRAGLVAAAVTGWLVGDVVARAAGRDRSERVEVFDRWDVGGALGERMRALGHSDGVTWRAVELARAMLAIEPGDVIAAGEEEAVVRAWLERPAVRAAAGWNEWQGRRFVSREAWDELLEAVVARDVLVTPAPEAVVRTAARRLERRMAAAGWELGAEDEAPAATSAPGTGASE